MEFLDQRLWHYPFWLATKRLYPVISWTLWQQANHFHKVSATPAKGNCFHFFLFPLTESSLFFCGVCDKTSCLVSAYKSFMENASYLWCNVAGSICFSFHIPWLTAITLVMEALCWPSIFLLFFLFFLYLFLLPHFLFLLILLSLLRFFYFSFPLFLLLLAWPRLWSPVTESN